MHLIIVFFTLLFYAHAIQIPSIRNVSMIPITPVNTTILSNVTCNQCLCSAYHSNASAINCFVNNKTCQLLFQFPRRYQLQWTSAARLFFPQQILPNPSECCASNWTQLSTATRISVNVSKPRCLVIDNHGYLVTVEDRGNYLSRFNAQNLSLIDSTYFAGAGFFNIAYHREAYFVGCVDERIFIINSNNLTIINTISSPSIGGPRDMIFLHNGQMMVLASADNNFLLFFNQTNNITFQYVYSYNQSTSYLWPHGLWYVNDSFFYATSWYANTIYSYSLTNNNARWTETLFVNAGSMTSISGGSHLTIDECGRAWFSLFQTGIIVFDAQGRFLANFNSSSNGIFDAIFLDNYVMFISDNINGKILRLDPNLNCA